MIKKFVKSGSTVSSEFLDHHASGSMIPVSCLMPTFAWDNGIDVKRTSEAGHSA
jgi:hypothetical protein